MKAGVLIFVFLLCCQCGYTQKDKQLPALHNISVTGNGIINPGVSYGFVKPLPKDSNLLGLVRVSENRTLRVAANIGAYWDPFSHIGVQNFYQVQVRSVLIPNVDFEYGLGGGFQGRFTGENYIVDENFTVEKQGIRTNWYLMGNGFVGFKISNSKREMATFLKLHLFLLADYNDTVLPTFMLELGKEF